MRFLLALLAVLLLAGCESRRVAAPAQTPPEASGVPVASSAELLDGFEGPAHTVWAFDSADDEGDASYAADRATQGQCALRVALRGKGAKGKFLLRREVAWDLSKAAALLLDVDSPAGGMQAALAFKADPGDVYQESRPIDLKKGLNRDLRFALAAPDWKHAETNWQLTGAPVNLAKVTRMMVVLYTGEQAEGAFALDNLRVSGSAEASQRAWRPEILRLSDLRAGEQFRPVEPAVIFRASYRDFFDRGDLSVTLRVDPPGGRAFELPGFFSGLLPAAPEPPDPAGAVPPPWGPWPPKDSAPKDAAPAAAGTEWPVWRARFTPRESGRYRIQWSVRNRAGEARSIEQEFLVVPQERERAAPGLRGGFVRISRRDPRRLELDDGAPFFVLGQNVCWTTDWKPYLEKIAAYGGNTCRIWLCPWGLKLERTTEPGVYDLGVARRIDELFRMAEAHGVRIVFCFTFHGANGDFWHESPYNRLNGGPCARGEAFFTDEQAKAQFKQLLDYAIARWSYSPALLAWETMNEADLAKYDAPEDVAAWALEMAGYLKANDPHGHLVTVSTTRADFAPRLWDDPRTDFVSGHAYGFDAAAALDSQLGPQRWRFKPFLLAEYGGGWQAADDAKDREGRRLQAALWLTACAPAAGCALPWWWDTQIEAHGLYPRFAAVARFLKDDERRARYGEPLQARIAAAPGLEVRGILDAQGGRFYVYRPDAVTNPEARKARMLEAAAALPLQGLLDGSYRVEYWDAEEGRPSGRAQVEVKGGRLELELPARDREYAIKLDREPRVEPGVGK